jgi:hypothetical protein
LAALAVTAAIAGGVVEVARTELLVVRHRRSAVSALAATDACLAAAVATLPPGWDFDATLVGPDAVAGTADDGALETPAACGGSASPAPGDPAPPRLHLTVTGEAGGGRRVVEALAGRAPAPGVPALLWLAEPPAAGTIAGEVGLDGADAADPTAPDWAGLAAPGAPAILDAWLAGEGSHVTASPRTLPPITAPAPPLAALATRIAAASPAGPEVLVPLPAAAVPALALVDGDLVVSDARRGAGLLFVQGTLDIRGSLEFTGIVVASGGVQVASGSGLAVVGALWVGPADVPGRSLLVDGVLTLTQGRQGVGIADGLLALPRRAVLLGVRDLG